MATAAAFGLALLGLLACGSSSDEDGDDAATERAAAPGPAQPRAEPRAATERQLGPSAADEDEPALKPAAMPSEGGADEAPETAGDGAGSSTGVPPAAAFASCARSEASYGATCDHVYVTMTQTSPELCVQLTIDNCGDGYTRQGLGVDTPISWQLTSASIGTALGECDLGVFYPDSTIVVDASGEISWDAIQPAAALPTGIVVDVTLQPSSRVDELTSIDVVTTEPLNPARCED
jgi:hypothetical protein